MKCSICGKEAVGMLQQHVGGLIHKTQHAFYFRCGEHMKELKK